MKPASAPVGQRAGLICHVGKQLAEQVSQLPESYRQAVALSELDGLPQPQVAQQLGSPLSGAKSRIQRGRAMLKAELEMLPLRTGPPRQRHRL